MGSETNRPDGGRKTLELSLWKGRGGSVKEDKGPCFWTEGVMAELQSVLGEQGSAQHVPNKVWTLPGDPVRDAPGGSKPRGRGS